ncbi:MAG: lamin tail domain-containing protein [Candidatus Uhrbacteria bacterium]
MKQKICFVALAALLLHQFGAASVMGAEDSCLQNSSTVFISEIGWAGSSKSSVDEWLELANSGDQEINLANWTIEGAGTGGSVLTLPETSRILPRSTYLIANYSSENTSSALSAPPNYINTAISLSNSSFHLALKNNVGCQIDEAGNGKAPFVGGTGIDGTVSMVRVEPLANGSLETSWLAAETSNGFDVGRLDLGTPGTIIWNPLPPASPPSEIDEEEVVEEEAGASGASGAEGASLFDSAQDLGEVTTESVVEETNINEIYQPAVSEPDSGLSEISELEESVDTQTENTVSETETVTAIEEALISEEIPNPMSESETATPDETQIPITETISEITITETFESTPTVEELSTAETIVESEISVREKISTPVETISETVTEETSEPPPTTEENTITETETSSEISESVEETAATTTETNSITPTIAVSYPSGTLIINEFVSDPVSGEKEWVEIINPYNNVIPLTGWKISESSGRTAVFSDGLLGYGQIAVAEFSSNVLNNSGDEIFLLAPNGDVIDSLTYGSAEIPAVSDPNSVARDLSGNFVLTETPTRGLGNVITGGVAVEVEVEASGELPFDSAQGSEEATSTSTQDELQQDDETTTGSTLETVTALETASAPPTVRLSELYPNTDGSDATDEFIELENYGSVAVNLSGLSLEDAAGNSWTFPDQTIFEAGKFLAVTRTEYKFALNNSGSETVTLYTADQQLLDQIQYENAPKKFTYSRDGDLWRWTDQLTPNEPNGFPQTVEPEDNGVVRQASTNLDSQRTAATESPVRVSIAEARALAADAKIILTGIVSVAPNIFGKQIFYLTDNQSGIQIYKSDGDFPELTIGDRVELTGTTSLIRGEPRVKIGKDDGITVLENNISLAVIETEVITEKEAGQLIKVAGMITEKSSTEFTIETASGLIQIKIKDGTEIVLTDFKPGTKITAVGIVGQSAEKFYLLPRSQTDLTIEKAEEIIPTVASVEPTGKQSAGQADQKRAIIIGSLVIAGLIAYAVQKRLRLKPKKYDKISKLSLAPAR